MKWLDDVSMDLRKMGVNEWRGRARNREAWRRIVQEAKAPPPRGVAPFGGGGGTVHLGRDFGEYINPDSTNVEVNWTAFSAVLGPMSG
jgi:hypothetical protein